MDSFGLRQEQETLIKNINTLKHQLEIGDARIKELHEEEMRYLKEIPIYEKQAKDAKDQAIDAQTKVSPLKQKLEDLNKDLLVMRGLNAVENKSLNELKETQKKIIEETKNINEQIKQRHEQLKQRELAVNDREKSCELREIGYKNRDFDLTKGEVELVKKIEGHKKNEEELDDKVETHKNNVSLHNTKVDALIEQKQFHEEDKIILQNKMANVDKLIKDNIDLKSQSLLLAEKMSKATKTAEAKQFMLDRAIDDLKNQENALKIKELKIQKMIKDAGLQDELKKLQAELI